MKINISRKFLKIHDLGSFRLPRMSVRHPAPIIALRSSRRRRRPGGAALAAPDDQTHALTCSQCSLMMLDRSRRPGNAPTASRHPQQPPDKIGTRFSSIIKKQNYIHIILSDITKLRLYHFDARLGTRYQTWVTQGSSSKNLLVFPDNVKKSLGN